MMQGLDVEPNPLAENWAEDKELEIIYQDDAMVVVRTTSQQHGLTNGSRHHLPKGQSHEDRKGMEGRTH